MSPVHPLYPLSGDSRQARAIRAREIAGSRETAENRLLRALTDASEGRALTRSQRRLLGSMDLQA